MAVNLPSLPVRPSENVPMSDPAWTRYFVALDRWILAVTTYLRTIP